MDNNHKTTTENIHVNKSTIGKNINHINTLYTLNSKTKDKTEDNTKSISQVSKDLIAHKSLCEEYKQHELARFNKVEETINSSVKNLQINIDDADELEAFRLADPSKTNLLIRRIMSCFKRNAYIGYTATPLANIFIDYTSIKKTRRKRSISKRFCKTFKKI